eukprot:SM000074S21648  [mRNA]  locus=s74:101407:102228:+ [translate_table: standard]
MHDFCFTFPYGALLLAGGAVGFLRKGSLASLAGGGSAGALLCWAGSLSLSAYHAGRTSYAAIAIELAVSVLLTGSLGQRYLQTRKVMPAGLVAGISLVMAVFYLYKLATGGNEVKKKATN